MSSTLALLDVGRVEDQLAVLGAVADRDAVQLEQAADDLDVADARHVVQPARCLAQQRGDHRLGDEVLGAADPDLAAQRGAAVDDAGRRRSTQPPAVGAGQWSTAVGIDAVR